MNKRRIRLLYSLTLAAAVMVFGIVLFPHEKIEKHVRIMFGGTFPGFDLVIEKTGPALPLAVNMTGLTVMKTDKVFCSLDYIRIGIQPKSFFSSGTSLSFQSAGYGGHARGTADFKNDSGPETADIEISGIRMEDIPQVNQSGYKSISGVLNGTLRVDGLSDSEKVRVNVRINNASVPTVLPFVKQDRISFKTITLEASVDRPEVAVKNLAFTGSQVEGQTNGKITLTDSLENSVLDLQGNLIMLPEFSKNFPVQMLPGKGKNKNGFGFKLTGTFAKPEFSFK